MIKFIRNAVPVLWFANFVMHAAQNNIAAAVMAVLLTGYALADLE